jgi:hypothetical protein
MANIDDINTTLSSIAQAQAQTAQNIANKFGTFVAVPTTSASSGSPGQCAYNGLFFYICVSSNSWLRTALASF